MKTLVVALAVAVSVLVLGAGCAHTPMEIARQLGCNEACARYAAERGQPVASAWPLEPGECACRMDDDSINVTCERPRDDGSCR